MSPILFFGMASLAASAQAAIVVSLWLVVRRSRISARRRAAAKAIAARIRKDLVTYIAGALQPDDFRQYARDARRELADAVMEFGQAVTGDPRERLCALALELALVHDWCEETQSKDPRKQRLAMRKLAFASSYEPCRRATAELLMRRLKDPDETVRRLAARGLAQSGDPGTLELVFETAISGSLLDRIVLAEDLRQHATQLCENAVPAALLSDNISRIVAGLQMVTAWERGVVLEKLPALLNHRDRSVRLHALRAAGSVPMTREVRSEIVRTLNDPDEELGVAAVLTAGRLRIEESLPLLARFLRTAPAELARTAAAALAELAPKGLQVLEEFSVSDNPVTAAAAAQALERVRGKALLW